MELKINECVMVQAGILTYLVKEIDQLVLGSAWYQLDVSQCEHCGRSPGDVLQLESELHLTHEAADRLQRLLADKSEEAKRREDENINYQNQVCHSNSSLNYTEMTLNHSKWLRKTAK